MHTLSQLRRGELMGIQRLQLREGLTEFPREIFDLSDSLEILDLSGNLLSRLPDDLPKLHKLRVIFCSDNAFSELPEVLGQCPHLSMVGFKANRIASVSANALPPLLRWLILTDNALAVLPAEVGHCTHMQKLMLAGNKLTALPPELANCQRLELLRISANQLTALPTWLLQMPNLTWLAYAGNPFTHALELLAVANAPTQHIPWQHLTLQHPLGEGASGVIHQADLHTASNTQAVAVKLFKGAVTSDGLPECEMAACMQAGQHPHLVSTIGRVTKHPQQAQALVMRLVAPEFTNLAAPPSLESCTRDVYANHQRFNWTNTLRMMRGIASAVHHLHTRGIAHGDIYGHNILHTPQGDVLLSDLGAATLFDPNDTGVAGGLEKLEVRAIGCLLEECLTHSEGVPSNPNVPHLLSDLMQQCLNTQPEERPSLATLVAKLDNLTA
ncbi:MAG: hypothetical protein RLZZ498_1061 [Pseudomonadota bacterium]|jgi:hypothetical protein